MAANVPTWRKFGPAMTKRTKPFSASTTPKSYNFRVNGSRIDLMLVLARAIARILFSNQQQTVFASFSPSRSRPSCPSLINKNKVYHEGGRFVLHFNDCLSCSGLPVTQTFSRSRFFAHFDPSSSRRLVLASFPATLLCDMVELSCWLR